MIQSFLAFLKLSRVKQPSIAIIRDLFGNRVLRGALEAAVSFGLSIQERTAKLFVWLCVLNQGVRGSYLAVGTAYYAR